MSGLLQKLDVSSDTVEMMRHAIALPFYWNRNGARSYRVGSTEGFDWIEFLWTDVKDTKDSLPLPFRITNADQAYEFCKSWLESAERGDHTDGDGGDHEGWHITGAHMTDFYVMFRLQTAWIYYSK